MSKIMSGLTEERIYGYNEFISRVRYEEQHPSGLPIIFVFQASVTSNNGRTWCPDSNDFDRAFRRLKSEMRLSGILVRIEVGGRQVIL